MRKPFVSTLMDGGEHRNLRSQVLCFRKAARGFCPYGDVAVFPLPLSLGSAAFFRRPNSRGRLPLRIAGRSPSPRAFFWGPKRPTRLAERSVPRQEPAHVGRKPHAQRRHACLIDRKPEPSQVAFKRISL